MTFVRVLVIAAILTMAGVAVPGSAAASCAESPPPAAAIFTGTVTSVDHGGRRATVKTDDGKTVTVVGTPDIDAMATSVDRTYAVGARYEFHALNASSPFMDNACTATRQVGAETVAPTSRSGRAVAIGGGVVVLAGLAVLTVGLLRRKRLDA